MKDDFTTFADKITALGRVMNLSGGREAVQFLLKAKGVTSRQDIMAATNISKDYTSKIVTTLIGGGVLDTDLRLDPGVKEAMKALSKTTKPEGAMSLTHGKKTAKFLRYEAGDPLIEGTCGPYTFTAITSSDREQGIWGCGLEHFVMRDTSTGEACAKHDPELGWTKRPKTSKEVAHFILIERLFNGAPKR